MTSGKSNEFAAVLLNHVFGIAPYAPPAELWVALSLAAFDQALTGSTIVEPDPASGYVRVSTANDGTTWSVAALDGTLGVVLLTSLVELDYASPTADIGPILAAYLVDAATDGMVLYGADLSAPLSVPAGSPLSVPAGAILIEDVPTE